jgi:hypothetical protein
MTNNAVFSSMIRSGKTTYFIDVKETKGGKKYLAITETRIDTDDKQSRSTIRFFAETIPSFQQAVNEAVGAMQL